MFFRRVSLRFLAIASSALLWSCSSRDLTRNLSDIESYIDERPDIALAAIRQIDTLTLRGRANTAKYSLLHAMALDKNYIDTADIRIVQPAVGWYDRHGTPEERLKAYMYLGVEQYNGGRYDNSIVSLSIAEKTVLQVSDDNLLGILYSRIADTYTKTRDYSLAASYIDKSIDCFKSCGRRDQERLEILRKAANLYQRGKHYDACDCYLELLSDPEIEDNVRIRVQLRYALTLMSKPVTEDSLALVYFTEAIRSGAILESADQCGAYACALYSAGKRDESESLMNNLLESRGPEDIYYTYWTHRISIKHGDYERAYRFLWEAKRQSDSLALLSQMQSAADAHQKYIEQNQRLTLLEAQANKRIRILYSILVLFLIMLLGTLYRKRQLERNAEIERINSTVATLHNQILSLQEEKKDYEIKIGDLSREKVKAKFAYLSELFAILQNNKDELDDNDRRNVYYAIKERVSSLNSDEAARNHFERMVNKESNDIMIRFRKDFPQLPDETIRLASFVFAGFDNITLEMALDETATNVRTLKNRLMKKIMASSAEFKEEYLAYFPRKS